MSILLDSLRKSEARRNIRETPSIHAGPEVPGQHSGRQWPSMALMAITLVAISWLGWKQYEAPETAGSNSTQQAQVPGATPSSRPTAPGVAAPGSGPAESRTPVERLSSEESLDPFEAVPADDVSPLDRIAGFAGEEEGGGLGEDYAESADETAQDDIDFRDLGDDTAGDQIDDLEQREYEARAAVERIRPTVDEPRSYWQLPQAWRSEMPDFKISVLVFADAPEDRFILLNGERLREGEELEDGLKLEEIRRDGAIFSYNGTKFLVKS